MSPRGNFLKYACLLLVLSSLGCAGESNEGRSALTPQERPIDPRARVLLGQAREALATGALQTALSHLDEVDRYQPDLPEGLFLRGHVSLAMRRLPAARAAFLAVLDRHPRYEAAWHSLGDVSFAGGQFRQAIRYYYREEAINPTPQTWYNIGNAYRMLEQPDSALIAYTASAQIDPAYAPTQLAMAEVLEARGDFEAALEHAQKALAADPSIPVHPYMVGQLQFRLGRLEEAEKALRMAVEAAPWDYSALYSLGQVLQRQGRTPEATVVLSRAENARQKQAEIRDAERTAGKQRDSAAAHVALAEDFIRAGRLDDALERFNIALMLDPENLLIQQNIASLTLAQGDAEGALARSSKIVELDSSRVGAWVILSAAYARLGRKSDSERAWRQAMRIDPDHPTVKRALGRN